MNPDNLIVLHTADVHLGAPMTAFGDLADQRRQMLRDVFLGVCQLAVEKRVHLFLCAGDLFDSMTPEKEEVDCAREGFTLLTEAGIPTFCVAGTHDGAGSTFNPLEQLQSTGLKILGGPGALVRSIELDERQVTLYSIVADPGKPTNLTQLNRRKDDGFHLGLLHASVVHDGMDVPFKDLPVTVEQLAALNLDYIALGHYHNFQLIETADKTIGCYPGTIEAKRFVEKGPRYCALITLTPQGKSIQQIEIGRSLVDEAELSVDDVADLQSAARKIRNLGGADRWMRIRLTGLREFDLDTDALEKIAGESFAFLRIIDGTEIAGNAEVQAIAGEPSVRGYAVASLLRKLSACENERERRKLNLAIKLLIREFDKHRTRRPE